MARPPDRSLATAERPGGIPTASSTITKCSGRKLRDAKGSSRPSIDMLTGQHGEYKLTFDKDGRKTSEKISHTARAGPYRSHDARSCICRNWRKKRSKRKQSAARSSSSIPNNGDILAMASWPTYDPNAFIPNISAEKFKALQDDPNIPLLPRAFRSSYPPGSTFKVAVGIAALESGTVRPDDRIRLPAGDPGRQHRLFTTGKKRTAVRSILSQALTESCDTWFYQVGIKTGRGADHRLGAEAGLWREVRDSVARRSGRTRA